MTNFPTGLAAPDLAHRLRRRFGTLDLSDALMNDTTASQEIQTLVTASVTPHAKGAWAEVVASVEQELTGIELSVAAAATSLNATDTGMFLDVGIGAAGSEVVIVPNVQVGAKPWSQAFPNASCGRFPVLIPRGSRLALRMQAVQISATATIGTVGFKPAPGSPYRPPTKLVSIGENTTLTKGVELATAVSANTKTGWTVIGTASVPLAGLVLQASLSTLDLNLANNSGLVDIGVTRPSSTVEVILPNLVVNFTSAEGIAMTDPGVHWVDIPAGEQIQARWQSAVTTNSVWGLHLTGVPE